MSRASTPMSRASTPMRRAGTPADRGTPAEHAAACTLQCVYRMIEAKWERKRLGGEAASRRASTAIQARCRGRQARRAVRPLLAENRSQTVAAAWRRFGVRMAQQRQCAASVVQARWRGIRGRQKAQAARDWAEAVRKRADAAAAAAAAALQARKAVDIQRAARGRRARSQMRELRAAATGAAVAEQERAALLLQTLCRGRLQHDWYKQVVILREAAAESWALWLLVRAARKWLGRRRAAASRIQLVWADRLEQRAARRRKAEHDRTAATGIQSAYRGRRGRADAAELIRSWKAAATAMQAACRGWQWRRRQGRAASAIADGYRRHLLRTGGVARRKSVRRAALTMQAGWRGCAKPLRHTVLCWTRLPLGHVFSREGNQQI